MACFHPRNFSGPINAGWSVARDIGDYAGYEAYKAFSSNSDRTLAASSAPNSLTLTAPAGEFYACDGFHLDVGSGSQCAGTLHVEVYDGALWVEAWQGTVLAADTFKEATFSAVTGSAFRARWSTASYGDTSELFFNGVAAQGKVLVRDPADGALKAWGGSSWTVVKASGEPDDGDYDAGMEKSAFVALGSSALMLLGVGSLEVYVRDGVIPSTLTLHALPPPQTVQQSGDYSLAGIDNIDGFTLNANVSGSGEVRALVSADSGASWSAWNGASWDAVAVGDIGTQGMSPAVLNAVPSAAWNDLILPTRTVRFAYWISKTALGDAARIDALASQLDMAGTWAESIRGTDYNVEWGNDFLRVRILAIGNWKINYQV